MNRQIFSVTRQFLTFSHFIIIKFKSPTACQKGITFQAIDDFLFINLPSGGWGQISTWGGKIVEVIDIMCLPIVWAHGLLLDAAGYVSSFYRKD